MKPLSKSIGFVIRAYAKNPDVVDEVVCRTMKTVRKIHEELGEYVKVLIVIPRDYDCGLSEQAFDAVMDLSFELMSVPGYHSREVLNIAVKRLVQLDIDISIILSNKAVKYIDNNTIISIGEAFNAGAKVVGIATDELKEGVCKGFVQNTFIAWGSADLLSVGGFDSKIDVEEVAPSIRLIKKFGKCIAVLIPPSQKLVIRVSKDGQVRHSEVMLNKVKNQFLELQRLGVESNFVTSAILHNYPKEI